VSHIEPVAEQAPTDLAVADLVTAVLREPPTLGIGRLVCVDGPAGSGKTTLAAALVRGLRDALRPPGSTWGPSCVRTLHMDNVYDGWAGLAAGMATVERLVESLAAGDPGHYRRFDWRTTSFAEERLVEPCEVLVIEGVGSGGSAYAEAVTCLAWVEAPSDVRLARALARDGERLRGHWAPWQAQEEAMFARERTRERADVTIDGTSGSPQGLLAG